MKIAEVESRFGDVKEFEKHLAKYGFHCTAKDTSHQYFYLFDFKKTFKPKKIANLPDIVLKPCLYKKRWSSINGGLIVFMTVQVQYIW